MESHWNTQIDGHNLFKVVSKMKLLKKPLRKLLHDQGNLHEKVNKLRPELDEERYLKQKAKVDWLEAGDTNSAYFHKTIKCRNQRSRIDSILCTDNVEVSGSLVPDVFVSHYEQFLGSSTDCNILNEEGLFSNKVQADIASNMVRDVTNDEIKAAMFDIGDDRAPGPDGYTSVFFKKGWNIVGDDICNAVCEFFSNGFLLKEINHTFLALIPKVSTPLRVNDYRPISCCNVIYKCISKIITNRIMEGIMEVVSDNQSFIPGRRISDNILITQELMHNYHRNRGSPRCAFKIDIQKAYDTVDWKFLENILIKFGFHNTMVNWIMACVSSTSFSLSINGNIHGFFKGKRGLRQGDPLSPYLFILVMEILTLILKRRVRLSESLDIIVTVKKFSLLMDCKILVEKAKNRIGDWKNKSLSFAGRLQLCKSVISSMHVFWASVLIIPKGIIYDIHQLIRRFLWCNGELKRGKAKIAWDDICLPKSEGGLGLRNLKVFNFALMTTHIWNIISSKGSLWVRWIHTYKLRGRTIWDVPVKDEMSWGWRKLLQLRDIMRPFFLVKLGNGNSTSLWYDNWCSSSPLINYLTPRDISREGFLLMNTVADLVSNGTWSWPQSWLLKAPDLGLITCPALVSSVADLWQWRDRNGNISSFSVAKAWHGLKTRDKMRQWDVGSDTDLNLLCCALCDNCPDSHTHLFFECTLSAKVWSYVRDLAGMDLIPPVLQDILLYLLPMGDKRTAKSVFGKLILAASASAYFIWMERNNRTFKNTRRSPEEIRDLIMVTELIERWKMPNNFRLYGN
uniref:Reverse transcriptase domain-containing protein n=1 Tax=Tanacetum cinerariifolium TaxID=118510 RepID=A0A6L2JRU9_TANCI|nr:hypothetical protein [Tanacetum cinerariifolium]